MQNNFSLLKLVEEIKSAESVNNDMRAYNKSNVHLKYDHFKMTSSSLVTIYTFDVIYFIIRYRFGRNLRKRFLRFTHLK